MTGRYEIDPKVDAMLAAFREDAPDGFVKFIRDERGANWLETAFAANGTPIAVLTLPTALRLWRRATANPRLPARTEEPKT